jgi:hypothetical protein
MVVAVVTPVVFCVKATEKGNKNTKIMWWLPKSLFITILQADRAYGTEISPRSFVLSFVILLYAILYNICI